MGNDIKCVQRETSGDLLVHLACIDSLVPFTFGSLETIK